MTSLLVIIWDNLHDLVAFAQFRKREKQHTGVLVTLLVSAYNFTESNITSWMFYTFKIVKIVPNCAKYHFFLENMRVLISISSGF